METLKRVVGASIAVSGFFLVTWVPAIFRRSASVELIVGISIAGGLLLSTGSIWIQRLRQSEGDYDERVTEIRFRAGWYTFWIVMAPTFAMGSIAVYTEYSTPWWFLLVIGPGGLVFKEVSVYWLKRQM